MPGTDRVKRTDFRWLRRWAWLGCLALFVGAGSSIVSAAAPRVIAASPDDGDEDVDPGTAVLRIEFDQDMNQQGLSLCGVQKADAAGKPRWTSPRVIELPIQLAPDRAYAWSINCQNARNFRGTNGEAAQIYPLRFQTRSAGAPPASPLTQEAKQSAIARLRQVIDEHYSYRDLRRTDWEEIFRSHEKALNDAPNWSKFARAVARLLAPARDVHLVVRPDKGAPLATFVRQVHPNFDWRLVQQSLPNLRELNPTVATGKFEDGIGYLLIRNWSAPQDLDAVWTALEEMRAAPALIVDVRPNAGGSEPLAAQVAGCFVREPAVYSLHETRAAAAPGGFSPRRSRKLEPNRQRPALSMPVAVLMGPANMSSCESFLLMMRTAPQCRLIGERSYGSSGNPQPHELAPGLTLLVPAWRDYLPNGELLEGQGVGPDLSVPAGAEDASDPVLATALAYLRSAEARHHAAERSSK